jgi:flavodoxin
MKSLVAYYSRTGNTKTVAEAVANSLNADVEPISSDTEGKGMGRLVMQALFKVQARIGQTTKDPSLYDVVVVGTPVWAHTLSSPVRTYLAKNKSKFKSVAFFCTYGGSGSERALKNMESFCGKTAVGTLAVVEKDVKSGEYVEKVKRFATELQEP